MSADPLRPSLDTSSVLPFVESPPAQSLEPQLLRQRICDFGLQIEGTPLGTSVARLRAELSARGITRVSPRFYLTDEWGVPEGTVAIGIPFYLADERLLRIQRLRGGRVEGACSDDILSYLRHEMGHVINYAYRLYQTEEWAGLFGDFHQPYREAYRALPFSRSYVRHLPGAYAQKHPDDDWAETFAVWMTPDSQWRELHGDSPGALEKLEYCERVMTSMRDCDPAVSDDVLDLEVKDMQSTIEDFYLASDDAAGEFMTHSLDGDLRAIFCVLAVTPEAELTVRPGSASVLLSSDQDMLANTVYRWTGVDPDLLKPILQHLSRRAATLGLVYWPEERDGVLAQLTAVLTVLAMNHLHTGSFFPR